MRRESEGIGARLEGFAQMVTNAVGGGSAFSFALAATLLWLASGPLFRYSDTWQLVWNTVTSVVTFLMVFLLQRSQNKESLALQLKLNELVAAVEGASNRLIDVEGLTEHELQILRTYYRHLADIASRDSDMTASHSIEEAERRQAIRRPPHEIPPDAD